MTNKQEILNLLICVDFSSEVPQTPDMKLTHTSFHEIDCDLCVWLWGGGLSGSHVDPDLNTNTHSHPNKEANRL